jgi:hypothetical protein
MTTEGEVNKKAEASPDAVEDDEIIELTDEITGDSANDEVIIELTEEVDEIIELTDEIKAAPGEDLASVIGGALKIGDDIDDEPDGEDPVADDFVESLGVDLETNSAAGILPEENQSHLTTEVEENASFASDAVSVQQIEAVIERKIMQILPEKIDSMLAAAIEKTLIKEIKKIKASILEDSSEDYT